MGGVIGFIATVVASAFPSVGLATAAYWATYIGISVGLSVGLAALSGALAKPPSIKPEDAQQSSKQPTQPRVKHYGRVKVSGAWVFAESNEGSFYKVIALGVGPVDAFEEFWIDDTQVQMNAAGWVTTEPWSDDGDNDNARILYRKGLPTETYYSELGVVFPAWTPAHRGDGVASLYVKQSGASQENYLDRWPNGINTSWRTVIRASLLEPIGGGTKAWGDNAANVIYDYAQSPDGMRLPASVLNTPMALQKWAEAFDRADENIALKAGGTEKRYRLWGSYRLDERPADVLGRMLASTDARLIPTPDGGLTLDIGTWVEPSVTLDADSIVGFSELSQGKDILNTANTIRAKYLDPDQDYQTADADPWVNAEDVTARGEISDDASFIMAPSHSQCRRLMKLRYYRKNPKWQGTFQCNLKALAAFGERFVRIRYTLGSKAIDEVFEIMDFKFLIGDGSTLHGVTIQVQSMPEAAYTWDPEQEEGDAPVSDETEDNSTIPLPTDDGRTFDVTISRKNVGGQLVPFALLTFDEPPIASLHVEARGKRTADTQWNVIPVSQDATEAESFVLSDGEEYEFQIRYSTFGGSKGDWTASVEIVAIADPTAPDQITGVSATGGTGTIDFAWTNPNSQNFAAVNIYRNTVDDFASATLVRTEYGPQSNADSWQDSGLSAGTYYGWLTARNASGIEATPPVSTGAITVT